MSLYNMVAGHNPSTTQILSLLGKNTGNFGRFRDVYLEDGYIVVHTRCGGGNREDYEYVFEDAKEHRWYSHNKDCDFDCTYADIYFKIPDTQDKTVLGLLDKGRNPEQMWNTLFEALKA